MAHFLETRTYRTDDQIGQEGDTGFIGLNLRKQPEQLSEGYLTESINGRIDMYWQPRKGMAPVSGSLITSRVIGLTIPFVLTS